MLFFFSPPLSFWKGRESAVICWLFLKRWGVLPKDWRGMWQKGTSCIGHPCVHSSWALGDLDSSASGPCLISCCLMSHMVTASGQGCLRSRDECAAEPGCQVVPLTTLHPAPQPAGQIKTKQFTPTSQIETPDSSWCFKTEIRHLQKVLKNSKT